MTAPRLAPAANPPPLPLLDDHVALVDAAVEEVWAALLDGLERAFGGRIPTAYARLVGCVPGVAAGRRPLTTGSALPGFLITAAEPLRWLELRGRHRFSTYALRVELEPVTARATSVRVESRAAFPGVAGRLYRLLVVDTGVHVAMVRHLLAGVARRAQHPTS